MTRHVTSVKCSKIEKKGHKKLVFYLTIQWSDGEKTDKQAEYVALFDFHVQLEERWKNDSNISIPVLPDAKKFDRGFLRTTKPEKQKLAVDDFFQKLLSLPSDIVNGDTFRQFFEYLKSESLSDSSQRDDKKPVKKTSSSAGATRVSTDIGSYECIDDVRNAAASSPNAQPVLNKLEQSGESIYWAVKSYNKQRSNEVNLQEGGAVSVLQKELSGWWFVQLQDTGEQGWAPATCLLPQDRKQLADSSATTGPLGIYQTVCDYEGRSPDELSYKKNEKVEVLEANMDGWWKVRHGGKVGYTPATHLEPTSSDASTHSDIYHHATVYKKQSPPPRRNEDESVEELYAKVERTQKAPEVPKKSLDAQKSNCSNEDEPDPLYSQIPDSVLLSPQDYQEPATATNSDSIECYASFSEETTKDDRPKHSYINVEIKENGVPTVGLAKSVSCPTAKPPVAVKPVAKSSSSKKAEPPKLPTRNGSALSDQAKVSVDSSSRNVANVEETSGEQAHVPTKPSKSLTSTCPTSPVPKKYPAPPAPGKPSVVKQLPALPVQPNGLKHPVPTETQSRSDEIAAPMKQATSETDGICVVRLERPDCEKLLTSQGKQHDYLLRESKKAGCPYALSVLGPDRVHHFPITLTPEHKYYIGQFSFDSVNQVLAYYQSNALCFLSNGQEVTLGQQLVVEESYITCRL